MAVLSRQKQPDGQTSRFQRQIAFSVLSRAISLSAAGPSYSQQKQAQLSTRSPMAVLSRQKEFCKWMARPPDFSEKLHFRYYPARSIYQRPGQAILSKSRPNGRFINARPNGRFIKAEATRRPDLQISATNFIFAIIPHDQFISGRAKLLRPNGRFINARPNGRFIKAEATGWPDRDKLHFRCYPARSIYHKPQAQLPFYQREAQWPFYQSRSNRMARPPDFNDKLHFRYYPARSIYQRPRQATQAQWPFYQRKAQWPFYQEQRPDSQTPDLSRGLQVPYYLAQSV